MLWPWTPLPLELWEINFCWYSVILKSTRTGNTCKALNTGTQCPALGKTSKVSGCHSPCCYYCNIRTTKPLTPCCTYSFTCPSLLLDCRFFWRLAPCCATFKSPASAQSVALSSSNWWKEGVVTCHPKSPFQRSSISKSDCWVAAGDADWFALGRVTAGKPSHCLSPAWCMLWFPE